MKRIFFIIGRSNYEKVSGKYNCGRVHPILLIVEEPNYLSEYYLEKSSGNLEIFLRNGYPPNEMMFCVILNLQKSKSSIVKFSLLKFFFVDIKKKLVIVYDIIFQKKMFWKISHIKENAAITYVNIRVPENVTSSIA